PNGSVTARFPVIDAPRAGQDGALRASWPDPQPPHSGDEETFARPLIGLWARPSARISVDSPTPGADPLPRRVRQASLAAELRDPPHAYNEEPRADTSATEPLPRRNVPHRSGAAIGAFQRQSRMARLGPDLTQQPTHPAPGRPDRP